MAASGGGPEAPHRPVLLFEAVELLDPARGGLLVDATLGLGGHSEAILTASPDTRVIGIDRDRDAIRLASERLARFGTRFRAVHGNFRGISRILDEAGEREVSGILADLGVSSLQFDTPGRGFSFRHDAPLDMRMDASGDEETAAELLERLPEEEIARVIYEYGEERKSRRIARWIVERRERGEPIKTTGELASLVARAVGYKRGDKVHPATRTFQALRIAVNGELEGLDEFVETAVDLLQARGRLAVISFHSLEDRVVKRALRRLSGHCECGRRVPVCACGARRAVEVLTRRPVVPSEQELEENPRARSAKLRACSKL
ncbi:MAG: 16S rRNA (cytosine(1402)-N(4))-methyltransferase RsmH [Acidobacteria bacterium]|nr:16S rRNA (cytosine(1402)-N(4))-methyltransferase RsmH [Acidobacteriota bacterium]